MEFKRNCPQCDKPIFYQSKYSFQKAEINSSKCSSCYRKKRSKHSTKEKKFKRNCPNCNREIGYVNEGCYKKAIENEALCQGCINTQRDNSALRGENNPHYGKSTYDFWLEKYGKKIADEKWKTLYKEHSLKVTGNKNGMYKKSLQDIWKIKYNEEEAKTKEQQRKSKISIKVSGEKNPMYGKPAPMGSGNGWKGWYKGIYFASLGELFYLKYLFDKNIKFENGEKRKYTIQYQFMNKNLNYFLDFYLPDTDEYIEIKPKKLVNSPKNTAKFKAAREKLGDKFKILTEDDIPQLDLETMHGLYLVGDIKFFKKYEEKFLEYYVKNRKE